MTATHQTSSNLPFATLFKSVEIAARPLATIALILVFFCSNPASAQSPASIIAQLRDDNPEAALTELGQLIDANLSINSIANTPLPSAAAGVFRALSQERPDDQFDWLLKWTMPTDTRSPIRQLATPVPSDAPPKAFARELSERPRDTSFPIATVGPMQGFFSSGWMLVQAAEEVGRLSRLQSDLEPLAEQNVAGAKELLALAHLADRRGNTEYVQQFLTAANKEPNTGPFHPHDLITASIACAALSKPELQATAESVLARLVEQSAVDDAISLRPFLRIAHATAVQTHLGTSPPAALFENKLKYWVPATVRTSNDIAAARPAAIWLAHEQHILHLAGGSHDILFCRFPLTGNFDFVCQTQEGGSIGTDGGLVYGGLMFRALGRTDTLTVTNADGRRPIQRHSPFARSDTSPVFNHVSICSRGNTPAFESNFHAVWPDGNAARQSPWLGLLSSGQNRPVFRGFQLTGMPAIPREVKLLERNSLRGWQSTFFDQTQPPILSSDSSSEDGKPDWSLSEGELVSSIPEEPDQKSQPALLQYQRPLLEEESISYQFFLNGDDTNSDDSIVHPAIGRIAFLLEPTGIRMRWITTGPSDWTSLPPDNALLDPLSRRGPRNLPLKGNDWNDVTLEQTADAILIKLNGELIYQYKSEAVSAQQFGLYLPSRLKEARIRNATLTGNWPESVPQDFIENPTRPTTTTRGD